MQFPLVPVLCACGIKNRMMQEGQDCLNRITAWSEDQIRMKLLRVIDGLSGRHLEELTDFAEFLYHKQHQAA